MKNNRLILTVVWGCLLFAGSLLSAPAFAEDVFWDALSGGKVDFSARYRFEHVNDDTAVKEANASTIRTTLGYTTGAFHGLNARLLAQDVRSVVIDDFNDATGRPGSKTDYAVVADPSATDFLEAYLGYTGFANTTVKLGRQIITYRDAPFHRFMGTVLWRQNWQNHDALTIQNKSLPDTVLSYAYSWNVNRIFTDEAVGAKANFDSDSHFFNGQYSGFKYGKFEAYVYLLDFANAAALSTATYGLRFNGGYPVTDKAKVIYTAEYAKQDDYAKNPANVNENYFLGELGGVFKTGMAVDNITVKFSYELLTGNGTTAFQTPLATGHAFQGWTDRFLTTPANGIADYYLTAVAGFLGAKLVVSYHDINSDNLSYGYGRELDVQLTKTFAKHYTVGVKYGDYNADSNASNVGATAADVSKFWTWVQLNF